MRFSKLFNITRFGFGLTVGLVVCTLGCVSVTAQRFDDVNKCWGESESVGHEFGDGSGQGSVAFAEGPDGDFWFFDSTPIPDEFELISEGPKYDNLAGKPSCREVY